MKPRVIVFGGCGFIGRNLVEYLITENVASEVRVVDKIPQQTAWLSETHKIIFDDPRVSFKSANLINTDSCKSALSRDDAETWDWAVNCAGETRYGQDDSVYEEGVVKLSLNCARQSAAAGIGSFLEISSSMSSSKRLPHKETDPIEPVAKMSRLNARVEAELAKIEGIRRVILRPAIVYGSGVKTDIMNFLLFGAVYKFLGERLKLLWPANVKMNTVHVRDLCRAIGFVLSANSADFEVYNVVDESDTTLGAISEAVRQIFGVETVFSSSIAYDLVKSDLKSVAEDANDKHLPPWAELCSSDGIANTPLSPYITADTLTKNHIYLDGTKLRGLGFTYQYPKLTTDNLLQILKEYAQMGLFPKSSLS